MIQLIDGGMGTLLQARGLRPAESPEDWNLERPGEIASVHAAYAEVGARVVYANTFGANPLKYRGSHDLGEVIRAGIALAKRSGARVALDIGPTGRLLKPTGDLDFDAAYEAFAETVRLGTAAGADLVAIETMGDLRELKAAVLAAQAGGASEIWATVALGENGKLLTGASVECVAVLLESLGVSAYGFNCGLGPERMLPFVERLAAVSTKPIIVKPNAGLPRMVGGRTVFDVSPVQFAAQVAALARVGASIVGGCCGTTSEHIRAAGEALRELHCRPARSADAATDHRPTVVSSGQSVVTLESHAGLIVGERINPTGKKALKEAYRRGDTAYVLREAVLETDQGSAILDINCGVPGIDEAVTLEMTLEAVQSVAMVPIQIDTADPVALERALRRVNGKALVNSVNGKRESMARVFPLVRRYGGVMVALCLDESGIPPTADGRLAIARRILAEGARHGFESHDFVFDALTLAVSADPQAANVTLETVRRLTDELGVNTILGVSNVSFGLPNRSALNNAMYTLAKRAGLSAAIANPACIAECDDEAAFDVLLGRDPNCGRWIAAHAASSASVAQPQVAALSPGAGAEELSAAISRGLRGDAAAAAAAWTAVGGEALDVIQRGIVPALESVGRGFEAGTVFLPQLLMAADAAGAAFEAVKRTLPSGRTAAHGRPIVLATVKGDIHDIGKNIVRSLLENYGFDVIDLGRDVAPETVVEAAARSNAMLVGLSALMTTTVGAMAETVRLVKAAGLVCRTCVGGAVVTQEYADEIGADYYSKDAMRTVRIAEALAGG